MWYVIKTPSGKEEKMMRLVERTLDKSMYTRCFIPRAEYVWRRQGKSNVDIEMLFDGYIFIEAEEPEKMFTRLKVLPGLVWKLPDGKDDYDYTIQQVHKEDELFLSNLLLKDPQNIVRLSYIHRDANKRIDKVEGPLEFYQDCIVSVDYKHRRVFANVPLFGREQRIKFCVKTDEDLAQV